MAPPRSPGPCPRLPQPLLRPLRLPLPPPMLRPRPSPRRQRPIIAPLQRARQPGGFLSQPIAPLISLIVGNDICINIPSGHPCVCAVATASFECFIRLHATFGRCPGWTAAGARVPAAWNGEDLTPACRAEWRVFAPTLATSNIARGAAVNFSLPDPDIAPATCGDPCAALTTPSPHDSSDTTGGDLSDLPKFSSPLCPDLCPDSVPALNSSLATLPVATSGDPTDPVIFFFLNSARGLLRDSDYKALTWPAFEALRTAAKASP
jgi:hypothetical protein